ncbi:hypothetical protein ANN_19659 [Periplaneta americana]|uniref:DUF4817 domain-containing protein n=1 Tax=Periplaneta americana TaxID=6978 RepID=A0ABQ8SAI1_PERAM|nr:hypothetical protein ANN_19659 [Periplaneta americana]
MRSNCCTIAVISSLARESWRNYRQSFPDSPVPSKAMIYNLVKKFRTTCSILDEKVICVKRVLTEEMLDEIGYRLERSRTSSRRVAQQKNNTKTNVNTTTPTEKLNDCRASRYGFPRVECPWCRSCAVRSTYIIETWIPTQRQISTIQSAEMRFLRSIKGCTRLDRIRSDEIREELNIESVDNKIIENRRYWIEYLLIMEDNRLPKEEEEIEDDPGNAGENCEVGRGKLSDP